MGDRPTQMFLLVILIFLAIVESLPLSDREHGILSEGGKDKSKWKNTERGVEMEFTSQTGKRSTTFSSKLKRFEVDSHPSFKTLQNKRDKRKKGNKGMEFKRIDLKIVEKDENEVQEINNYNATAYSEDVQSQLEERTQRQKRSWGISLYNDLDESVDNTFNNKHVKPCAWLDRMYCQNGGICVYVEALDIKTCRCRKTYTGSRCEMLDLQYLMSTFRSNDPFSDFGNW